MPIVQGKHSGKPDTAPYDGHRETPPNVPPPPKDPNPPKEPHPPKKPGA
ncbi:hypothetical protein ACIQCR_16200 [Streptomyces sp. NPDC093249]